AVYLYQGGLGLPDRGYYLDSTFADKKAQWERYAATMLKRLDWPQPEQAAKAIVAYESEVAAASWTRTQQRDPDATYNPMSLAEIETFAPGFDWAGYLGTMGVRSQTRFIVSEKTAFP